MDAESTMGFTLGFLVTLVAIFAWKQYGKRQERARTLEDNVAQLQVVIQDVIGRLGNIAPGSSDAALAQLSGRLNVIEKQLAQQDLTILDTAERVAHKLQDRRRKRDAAEVGDVDEIPNDPNLLLAHARKFYNQDPAQLRLEDAG